MDCPVCSKEFCLSIIEEHVEKCFSARNDAPRVVESPQTKRAFPFEDRGKNPPEKKPKTLDTGLSATAGSSAGTNFLMTKAGTKNTFQPNKNANSFFNGSSKSSNTSTKISGGQGRGDHVPLAEKMRPSSLSAYVGHKDLLGPQTVLGKLLQNREIPSMILWGPPGCGKTSLANVIAKMTKEKSQGNTKFVKLSATSSGIGDIRDVVSNATKDLKLGIRTIVFMDEIHRFNKLQQDIFLPHVEAGSFTLIGATTENPSFSLNSALLSRCRVFVLEKLSKTDVMTIIEKGVRSLGGDFCGANGVPESPDSVPKFFVDREAARWLAEICDGDARVALGGLEIATKALNPGSREFSSAKTWRLGVKELKAGLEKTHTLSERKCDLNYDLISAMQKSVRAGDANAALYWLARLMAGGEDPVYMARRLLRVASEDVGFEDPEALDLAMHTLHACEMVGMPECDIILGQCAIYLARAEKSCLVDRALRKAQRTVMEHKGPQPSVPLHIRDRGGERKLQASLGAGRVNLLRKPEESKSRLPAGLENVNFFI